MSTFDGKVKEFPDIRIDYFRADRQDSTARPPLAYFLSHVHSDHLQGLETCKSPFIYCTPATRDILLRLEKYPHRMNFAKGILEMRIQTYRHLSKLLKAIPLETPTVIELTPQKKVRATLFDANHCVGACMFLIEGDGNAILYTGDIRSEVWWVNSLVRNPILQRYACPSKDEPIQRLDCIYIDTTFVVTGKEDPYRDFASKAQGIDELLRKVAQYPSGTQFYFDSWTFGYEDVWQALSSTLDSPVHLDDYRYRLYLAMANSGEEPKAPEAQKMIGYRFRNEYQAGYLTAKQSRLHSCEKGTGCEIWEKDFVRITPIVSRYQGVEIAELGAGGGQSDLNQRHELSFWNAQEVSDLMAYCTTKFQGQPQLLTGVLSLLTDVIRQECSSIELADFVDAAQTRTSQQHEAGYLDLDGLPLDQVIPALAKIVASGSLKKNQAVKAISEPSTKTAVRADGLPKQITFPYSRHSSYNELLVLLEAFKPKDIFPCTVDEKNWKPHCSMSVLFGDIYQASPNFRHDNDMLKKHGLEHEALSVHSRPGSSASMNSVYATPNEDVPNSYRRCQESGKGTKRSSDETSECEPAPKKRRSADHEGSRLYIGNLGDAPEKVVREKLERLFKGCDIRIASIPIDSRTGHALGYAFVDFFSPFEAQRVINEKHVRHTEDETLTVQLAEQHSNSTAYAFPNNDVVKSHRPDQTADRGIECNPGGRNGHNSDARKRTGSGREAHGDFWPPLDDDRYSTPAYTYPNHKHGQPILSDERVEATLWPTALDYDVAVQKSPIRYRGQVLLDQQGQANRSDVQSCRIENRKSITYGRLSPPIEPPSKYPKARLLVESELVVKSQPAQQSSPDYGRLSPPPTTVEDDAKAQNLSATPRELSSPFSRLLGKSSAKKRNNLSPAASSRLAARKEAHDAVLGIDGRSWNDVGLVSVSGHYEREEEL